MAKIIGMDKSDYIIIKTGINVYRACFFLLFSMCFVFLVGSIICKRDIVEIISSSVLTVIFLLCIIFMEKMIDILHLPTHKLIVSKENIIYYKKKPIEFKLSDVKLEFGPVLDSVIPLLVIRDQKDILLAVSITKKQYLRIMEFIQ